MKKILTFALICLALVCALAFAEEAAPEAGTDAAETTAVVRSPYLDIAFSCLEAGNPILRQYNEITGADIQPMLETGMPYYFGGQDYSRLLTVGSVWASTAWALSGISRPRWATS